MKQMTAIRAPTVASGSGRILPTAASEIEYTRLLRVMGRQQEKEINSLSLEQLYQPLHAPQICNRCIFHTKNVRHDGAQHNFDSSQVSGDLSLNGPTFYRNIRAPFLNSVSIIKYKI